ncbi:hypothetical protein HY251_12485 [bacterium]|nr:hypothetical protein [bacterium]
MRFFAVIGSFALALAVAAGPVSGADSKEVDEKDDAARLLVAEELSKLAAFCAEKNAPAQARSELELALLAERKTREIAARIEELRSQTGSPPADFGSRHQEEQKKAYEKCTRALLELAPLLEKESPERFSACLDLLDRFPGTNVASRFDATFFEPYSRWIPAADARRLESGSEFVDGKWLERAQVTALDRSHATWKDPWVVSDGVHEVRTTLPLRTARQLLSYIGTYRRFLVRHLAGLWEIAPPKGGLLPVIVTASQADHRARWEAEPRTAGVPLNGGAACYLVSSDPLNPCFVTFEPVLGEGRVAKVPLEVVLSALTHEITHQIVFEHAKPARKERDSGMNAWCVEGLAAYMQQWKLERGRWRLERAARNVPLGGGRFTTLDPAFAWAKEHEHALPPLSRFLAIPKEKFYKLENYHMAGTLTWFLLEGEKGKYRKSFARFLELVHESQDDEKSFSTCFEGVDQKVLQAELTRFVAGI